MPRCCRWASSPTAVPPASQLLPISRDAGKRSRCRMSSHLSTFLTSSVANFFTSRFSWSQVGKRVVLRLPHQQPKRALQIASHALMDRISTMRRRLIARMMPAAVTQRQRRGCDHGRLAARRSAQLREDIFPRASSPSAVWHARTARARGTIAHHAALLAALIARSGLTCSRSHCRVALLMPSRQA